MKCNQPKTRPFARQPSADGFNALGSDLQRFASLESLPQPGCKWVRPPFRQIAVNCSDFIGSGPSVLDIDRLPAPVL